MTLTGQLLPVGGIREKVIAAARGGVTRVLLPNLIEEIKNVMRRRGLTNNDLKPCIGSSGNVCDILMRRRPLFLRMIRNLL